MRQSKIINFVGGPGTGKCHGIDTPVLMYDGSIKMVQDIKVGELLMGDDSLPRKVCSLARGREMLYEIQCKNGESFTVNKHHILCCLETGSDKNRRGSNPRIESSIEISVKDYLSLSKTMQEQLKCYTTSVNFPEQKPRHPPKTENMTQGLLDPYLLGVRLGEASPARSLKLFSGAVSNAPIHYIPHEYKCNSRGIRLKVLAGIIDSCGDISFSENSGSVWGARVVFAGEQIGDILVKDICYLCRSLGFRTTIQKTRVIITLSGSNLREIPSKKNNEWHFIAWTSESRGARKKSLVKTSFKVVELKVDDYYGFSLDGNHRYLLGNFIVSHNSTMAASCFVELKSRHLSAEYVQEYAKMLVYKRKFDKLNQQYLVSMHQYKMIKAVDGCVDYICLDSPLLLGLLYNRQYESNVSNVEKTEDMILSKMKEFDNIYIFLERNNAFKFETTGRVHNEDESMNLDVQIKRLLDKLELPYLTVKSDTSNIEQVINYVLGQE